MSDARVTVTQGQLEGAAKVTPDGISYYSFKGIPYAEPPIGDLRFRPPVPIKPWQGVRQAINEGSHAPQIVMKTMAYSGNEDCLYLNIYTPRIPTLFSKLPTLPVMVLIHSGAFIERNGSQDSFGPDFLIAQDVILVAMNYRLGPLGFLCLDIPEAPGNIGLKDQNLALKWIKENITSFYGDPSNITLFGMSAGSASVEYQMLSPMSENLFQKAILESGSCLNPWAQCTDHLEAAHRLAKALQIDFKDHVELLEKLKQIDAEKLITAAKSSIDIEKKVAGELPNGFIPVVEQKFEDSEAFLCEDPFELLKSGRFNRCPTITGFCKEEGMFFKMYYAETLEKMKLQDFDDNKPLRFKIDKADFGQLTKEVYKLDDEHSEERLLCDFLSDSLFIGGIFTSLMHRVKYSSDFFVYEFFHDGAINYFKQVMKMTEKGPFHCEEYTYLTRTPAINDDDATAEDKIVRQRMVKMWTNFAKKGHPTPEQTDLLQVTWPRFTEDQKLILEIGEQLREKPMPHQERLRFWRQLYEEKLDI